MKNWKASHKILLGLVLAVTIGIFVYMALPVPPEVIPTSWDLKSALRHDFIGPFPFLLIVLLLLYLLIYLMWKLVTVLINVIRKRT